ncbi:MAG: hypothetical protein AAF740_11865 [Bacteroidota bacterium]
MKKAIFVLLISVSLAIGTVETSDAQCAMCRATVENNVSNGVMDEDGMGLNGGILYLLAMPYLLIGTVAFFWYRNSKKNHASKKLTVEKYS